MAYISIIILVLAVIVVSITGTSLLKLSINQRVKIDNISIYVFGLISLVFVILILSSFHLFDKTYFDNIYDYRYNYRTLEGDTYTGEFDEYKNIDSIELKDTKLYIMSFRELDNTGLANTVYYQVKTVSDVDYDYEVSCNGTSYMKLYAGSTTRHIMNNDELALFCSEGDTISVKLINGNESSYQSTDFEYNLQFDDYTSIPNIKSINELNPVLMMFVFIVFLVMVYKKIGYHTINQEGNMKNNIVSKIVIVIIVSMVFASMIVISNHEDGLNIANAIDEGAAYLEESIVSDYGKIDLRYNYLTDTLQFRPRELEAELDITFEGNQYVNLRTLDFETLDTIYNGWYTIENIDDFSSLTITLYDNSNALKPLVFEEEVSLLHPYYE